MADLKTTQETLKTPLDGTELIRLATPGANWKTTVSALTRISLTGDVTYNVSTTGNDVSGDGSAGNPWATAQHAADFIASSLDLKSFTATVQFAAGTYVGLTIPIFYSSTVFANVKFIGDTVTPTNVILTENPNGNVISSGLQDSINTTTTFSGFEFLSSSSFSDTIDCTGLIRGVVFEGPNVVAGNNTGTLFSGCLQIKGGMTIDGASMTTPRRFAYVAKNSSGVNEVIGIRDTITFTGSPNFTSEFVASNLNGILTDVFATYSGTATASRRFAVRGGIIRGASNGKHTFPGTLEGTIENGGIYDVGGGKFVYGVQGALADDGYNYSQPAAGFNLTVGDAEGHVILDPAAGLANGTITTPANPANGQMFDVRTTQTITALTVAANTGQNLGNGAPATLVAGTSFNAIFKESNATWYFG